jgi:hypothetical protein
MSMAGALLVQAISQASESWSLVLGRGWARPLGLTGFTGPAVHSVTDQAASQASLPLPPERNQDPRPSTSSTASS